MEKIRIKDTGLDKVNGTLKYSQVNSGNWIDTNASRINYEFNTKTTNNESTLTSNGELTFNSNEVTAIIPPRFTISVYVLPTDTQGIQDMIRLGRTLGIKRLSKNTGVIPALPEVQTDTHSYVSVIVKNVTPVETAVKDVNYIKFTIQMEQVV